MDLLKREAHPTIDYSQKRIMIVDDFADMRSSIRSLLTPLWASKITMVESASSAIARVRGSVFDIILCDYNLWPDEKNWQQLLEELRYTQMITFKTAFIMVTAETTYEYVVAVAELAPDAYIIKPFNFSTLRDRMNGVLVKKTIFTPVYELTIQEKFEIACDTCDKIIIKYPTLKIDALRFKAELLMTMKKYSEAEKIYLQINAESDKIIPWARFWLVQAFHFQWKNDTAEQILHNLIGKYPQMIQSYDLLADIQESKKEDYALQKTLELWVSISPKSVLRQRRLGDVALRNGDHKTAINAFKKIVWEKRSYNFNPTDMAKLAKTYCQWWDTVAAKDLLLSQQKFLRETNGGSIVYSSNMADIYAQVWDIQNAQQSMADALHIKERTTNIDTDVLKDMAETCRNINMDGIANSIDQEVYAKEVASLPKIEPIKKDIIESKP